MATTLQETPASAPPTTGPTKGPVEGMYIGRRLLPASADKLRFWLSRHGVSPSSVDPNLHVTVAYSPRIFHWMPDDDPVRDVQIVRWRTLGSDRAVVLELASPRLQARFDATLAAGAEYSFGTYLPHVTLFYLPAGYDSQEWRDGNYPPVPGFSLDFGPELMGPLGPGYDVFEGDIWTDGQMANHIEQPRAAVGKLLAAVATVLKFDPNQPRAKDGKWTAAGAGAGGSFSHDVPGQRYGGVDISRERKLTPWDTDKVLAARATARTIKPTWTKPGREQIRKAAVDAVYGQGAKTKNRVAHLVIGGPGAGKSSAVADRLAADNGALIIDSDEIKKHLPEFAGGAGAGAVHEESAILTEGPLTERAIRAGDNVVMPMVGRVGSKVKNIARELHELGYEVHLHYVDLSKEKQVERALARFEHTGRFVDPDYVYNTVGDKPRYTYENLKTYPRFRTVTSYSNDVPLGAKPILLESLAHAPFPTSTGRIRKADLGADDRPIPGADATGPGPHPGAGAGGRVSGHAASAARGGLASAVVGLIEAVAKALGTQPRAPKGSSIGGQWIKAGGGAPSFAAHLSGGTSAMPQLYNKSVQALGAAFSASSPAAAKAAIEAIKGPPAGHSFGRKFAALKAQALGMVAEAEAANAAAKPVAPVLNLPWPNKQKWNSNLIAKLTAAASSDQPLTELSAIALSKQAHKEVHAYKAALLAYHGATQAGGNPAPTTPAKAPAAVKYAPSFHDITGKDLFFENAATQIAAKAMAAAYEAGDLKKLSAIAVDYGAAYDYKQVLLSQMAPETYAAPVPKPKATPPAPKPAKLPKHPPSYKSVTGFNKPGGQHGPYTPSGKKLAIIKQLEQAWADKDPDALAAVQAGYSGNTVKYQAHLLDEMAKAGLVPKAGPTPGGFAPKIKTMTEAPATPGYHHATESLDNTINLKGHKPPKPPPPPPLDPSFPADQQELFKKKIAALDAAYGSADPVAALSAISAYADGPNTPKAYKEKLLKLAVDWESTKPVEPAAAGSILSTWKVVKESTAKTPYTPFPEHHKSDFNARHMKYRAALTQGQKKALDSYQGSGYGTINGALRADYHATSEHIKNLDTALAGITIEHDVSVVRNIQSTTLATLAKKMVGRVVEDPAYMSTSLHGGFGSGSNVQLRLNVPKGTRGTFLSTDGSVHSGENEILLPRRTQYRIDKVETKASNFGGNTITVLHATVLPPHEQKGWVP